MPDSWAKTRAEADIAQFKTVVEDATVEDVDEPTGTKNVEIAYNTEQDFIIMSGEAVGVYYEPSRLNAKTVHIDWADDRARTTAQIKDVTTLEESEYYTDS